MRLCLPSGPTDHPKLAIVGEAPGEHEAGRTPFLGYAGKLLTSALKSAGVPREACYLTNVMQIRPPGNDFSHFYDDGPKRRVPTPALTEGYRRLIQELDDVRPSVIIPVGKEALQAVAQTKDQKNLRGTMIHRYNRRILPTYHPSYINRDYAKRPIFEMDLKKAYRQARFPFVPKANINHEPSYSEIMAFLKERPSDCSVDIETVDLVTRCIGIATSKYDAIVIPLSNTKGHSWSEGEETDILLALREFLLCPHIKKYLQNFPFDTSILEKELGLRIQNIVLDTMFAHHTLYSELPKSLDMLCSLYTDWPMYWDFDVRSDAETQLYCGYDCLVTYACAHLFRDDLKERGMYDFYHKTIHPVASTFTRMQDRGVLIDVTTRAEIDATVQSEMEALLSRIQTHVGFDLNPSSPKQLQELLYGRWRLPKQKNKEKRVTTDADALKSLRNKFPEHFSLLSDIITFREKRVLLSTFVRAPLSATSRVHTSYNPAGTVTGRASSSKTLAGLGGNLQNIPRGGFRRVFIADPGKLLVKADYKQAEYRVLIWKARIQRVIKRLLEDPTFNIHMWNASENIYRKPVSEVTKTEYSKAKNGVFGANYGIQALKVSRMYDMPLPDAKLILRRYHSAVPEIERVYQAEIREAVRSTRSLTNPLGWERLFFGRMDETLFRAAYSHYCQSTVAHLIDMALVELDSLGFDLLLQVHDEIVLQCSEFEVDAAARAITDAMAIPLKFEGVDEPLVIPIDIHVGPNWYETEEYKVA